MVEFIFKFQYSQVTVIAVCKFQCYKTSPDIICNMLIEVDYVMFVTVLFVKRNMLEEFGIHFPVVSLIHQLLQAGYPTILTALTALHTSCHDVLSN